MNKEIQNLIDKHDEIKTQLLKEKSDIIDFAGKEMDLLSREVDKLKEQIKIKDEALITQDKMIDKYEKQINQQNKLIQSLAEKIYYLQEECNDRDDCPGTIDKQQCIDCIIKLAKEKVKE